MASIDWKELGIEVADEVIGEIKELSSASISDLQKLAEYAIVLAGTEKGTQKYEYALGDVRNQKVLCLQNIQIELQEKLGEWAQKVAEWVVKTVIQLAVASI